MQKLGHHQVAGLLEFSHALLHGSGGGQFFDFIKGDINRFVEGLNQKGVAGNQR
ncbi:MAG TPA: hypothetical protein VGM55_05690 [Cedecea sp.]